ncbi:MAG: cupin domain-containing protein [Candidatus Cloacimonetes bacterium]|nr:cupin domain-containing protein [Candidatus Cloacimonadota bacterium]
MWITVKISNYKEQNIAQNPHGIEAKKLYDYPQAQIMHLHLQAGEALKKHITPVDVAFYVLEGSPTIEVGKEKIIVKKDDLVESPKDIPHCIYNETDEIVRVLVMKLPRPSSKTVLV